MRLWVYAVRRVALALPVVIGILTVVFVLICAIPRTEVACSFYSPVGRTSPCTTTIPCPTNPATICPNPVYEAAVQQLGLNQPIFVQWLI